MQPDADRRRELGAWYTPPDLVAHVVANTVPLRLDGPVTVLDPACGDGRFLVEAARVVRARGGEPVLLGVDIDESAIESARRDPRLAGADLWCADSLAVDAPWRERQVDIVVGNPPFLSPLSATVSADERRRGGRSTLGAYADVAVRFLDLMVGHVRAPGGRVGLVLPISVLGSRDAEDVRRTVTSRCDVHWFWWSPEPVFDAAVTTCALTVERVTIPRRREVTRAVGIDMRAVAPAPSPSIGTGGWGALIADQIGIPRVDLDDLAATAALGRHAEIGADFRDQYYGVLSALVEVNPDDAPSDGVVPLVTTAHIDPGRCHWGQRRVRYGKRQWQAPCVDLSLIDGDMTAWIARRIVPKVLVATQTSVIEAVADVDGRWLPAVPVISIVPRRETGITLEEIAAVLTSPVPSALMATRAAGTGLSPRVVRVTAAHLAGLPWPDGALDDAVAAWRSGHLRECAAAATRAYGISGSRCSDLVDWWMGRLPRAVTD